MLTCHSHSTYFCGAERVTRSVGLLTPWEIWEVWRVAHRRPVNKCWLTWLAGWEMDGWMADGWIVDFLLCLTHFWYIKSDNSIFQKERKGGLFRPLRDFTWWPISLQEKKTDPRLGFKYISQNQVLTIESRSVCPLPTWEWGSASPHPSCSYWAHIVGLMGRLCNWNIDEMERGGPCPPGGKTLPTAYKARHEVIWETWIDELSESGGGT